MMEDGLGGLDALTMLACTCQTPAFVGEVAYTHCYQSRLHLPSLCMQTGALIHLTELGNATSSPSNKGLPYSE